MKYLYKGGGGIDGWSIIQVVGGIDERSGVYILDEDATTAADFYNQTICQTECIYRRRHDTTGTEIPEF